MVYNKYFYHNFEKLSFFFIMLYDYMFVKVKKKVGYRYKYINAYFLKNAQKI